MARKKSLSGLTSIRFFAALWVMAFHGYFWAHRSDPFSNFTAAGYAGVSVFFVLSGFILSYNYLDSEYSSRTFWVARLARIFPIYAIALLLCIPPLIHAYQRHEFSFSAGFLAPPLLLQAWIPSATLLWNPPGWSVSVETFFYLVFPFVVQPLAGMFRQRRWTLLATLWILGAVPSVLFAFYYPGAPIDSWSKGFWIHVIKYDPLVRLPEFLLGICIGTGFRDGWRINRPRLTAASSFVAIAAILIVFDKMPYPSFHDGLLAPLFALLILSIASSETALDFGPLVLLGEASYSLYILSDPLFAQYSFLAKHIPFLLDQNTVPGYLIYAVFAVLISIVSYRFVETPSRIHLRGWLDRRPAPRMASVLTVAADNGSDANPSA